MDSDLFYWMIVMLIGLVDVSVYVI